MLNVVKGGSIPGAKEKPSECVLEYQKICSSPNEIGIMQDFLQSYYNEGNKINDADNLKTIENSAREIIDHVKKVLKVDSESAIWEHKVFKEFVGSNKANNILKKLFKPEGPSNSNALLNNFNIDDTLEQWSINGNELFNKKVYHVPFQMIDFAKTRKELSYLNIANLLKEKYSCFVVVLNTDVSSGGGKHWFCMYGDLEHKGTEKDPINIEYFNSSGNRPPTEVDVWAQKTMHDLLKDHKIYCNFITSAPKRLQYSMTECGVWSLMYIKSRLKGHAPDWFYKVKADDVDMLDLRKHLFRKEK